MTEVDRVGELVDTWLDRSDMKAEAKVADYSKSIFKKLVFIAVSAVAAIVIACYAVTLGNYPMEFTDPYVTIWNHITGNITNTKLDYVVWTLRMPRICTGILAGAGLAVAGAVMQSILRNPLADPYTTGISSGASFGASLAIILGFSLGSAAYAIVINAFIFALVPMFIIIGVSRLKTASPTTMIMTGISVMYIFNAITTVIKFYASPEAQATVFSWSVGTIEGNNWYKVGVMAVFVIVGIATSLLLSRRLNVVATGDESARSMGVNANRLRTAALGIVSLTAAGIVSFTGLIGFIGLVCPHVARIFIGSDNRYLIPASAALGAALLIGADAAGRMIATTLPVGVITSFIGGPMFLYLVIRSKKEAW